MLHLKNIEIYTPDVIPEGFEGFSVIYFRSQDGQDFYEAIKEADPDTMKILYADNVVTGFSPDASSLYPAGSSLIEVPADKVPEDIDIDGRYLFNSKTLEFTSNPEFITQELDFQKAQLLTIANEKIAQYQDKVDLGDATDMEVQTLKEWKAFRVKVREAKDIDSFPAKPRF